jgi:uncharacterized membrane protein YgcG
LVASYPSPASTVKNQEPTGTLTRAEATPRDSKSVDRSAPLRSVDMHRCWLTVVHTRHWEAYASRLKLVEFRSPRQTIAFCPGMILLLSMNAYERRTGRSELLMANVLEILLLECKEAYARFPLESHACNLNSLCKRWRGNGMVQCLVLDKSSLRIAHEICHLAVGNLGVLRQINGTTGMARFCCREDLGKTVTFRLCTGKRVLCTFAVTWPRESDTTQRRQPAATGDEAGAPRASDGGRGGGGGGGSGGGGATSKSHGKILRSNPPSFVSGGILPVVTKEQLSRVVGIMACCPARQEVDRALTAQGRMEKQPLVTTLAEVQRALQKNRFRVANDKDFRPLLLQRIIQYVCNSVTASEAGLSHDQGFSAQLKSWIKQRLIPFLKETSLSEYVPALETAVGGPAASQEGGLPTSRTVVPVNRALDFSKFQHQKNCCEKCAAPCDPSKEQGFACNCGAIVCREGCYGLTRQAYQSIVRTDEFKYECDSCREQHCGKQQTKQVGLQQNSACFSCRILLSGLQVRCPRCLGRFCQGCACMARFEVASATSRSLNLLCPTCVGQT